MSRRAFLSDFELMVLVAVLRVGEDAYGLAITQEIEEVTGRPVTVAGIYAALQRLENKGLVSSALGEPTAIRGGRAKRFFRVTAQGMKEAREARRVLTALWNGVPALKGGLT
jgi:PadR family transcriptional regulator, regulatory protein PadR